MRETFADREGVEGTVQVIGKMSSLTTGTVSSPHPTRPNFIDKVTSFHSLFHSPTETCEGKCRRSDRGNQSSIYAVFYYFCRYRHTAPTHIHQLR
jgi:hypothetical protein